MLEKKKLRDIAESISGIRPSERSLEGIVSFIEEKANIVYEKQPRTFLGRLRELGYALNGVRPTQRSLRGIVNNIYENFSPEPPVPPVTNKILGVSGLASSNTELTRTYDAVGLNATLVNADFNSDFNNLFPYNEMKRTTINGNVFVKIPAMWFLVKTDENNNLTDIAVAKEKDETYTDGIWYQTKEFYYGAYTASTEGNYVDKMRSVSGGTIMNYKTSSLIENIMNSASLNGEGYIPLDIYHQTIITFLWLIEMGSKNCFANMFAWVFWQTKTMQQQTGQTDGVNVSGLSGNSNAMFKWHDIEMALGNVTEILVGARSYLSTTYNYLASSNPQEFTNLTNQLSYRPQSINNDYVIKTFGWDSSNPFLCLPKDMLDSSFQQSYDQYYADSCYAGTTNAYITGCPYGQVSPSNKYGMTHYEAYTTQACYSRLLYCPNGV